MKNYLTFRSLLMLFLGIVLIGTTTSCKKEDKAKENAEEINEDRFDNHDKEKDAEFVVDAATMDLQNIELAKLAMRSTNADIKSNAKMMEDAHTKSYNEIKMMSEQKNIAIPMSISTDAVADYKNLNDKTGADFDKKYIDVMIDNHEKEIRKYEDYIKDSKDPEIRTWAENNLTELRAHLDHVKQMKETYK